MIKPVVTSQRLVQQFSLFSCTTTRDSGDELPLFEPATPMPTESSFWEHLSAEKQREVQSLIKIGVEGELDIPVSNSGDGDDIDPLAEDALEFELKKTGAYALSNMLEPLRKKQKTFACWYPNKVKNAVEWAHHCHINRDGFFKFPLGHYRTPLSSETMESLKDALRISVYEVVKFHEAWEYLEVNLATRVARATDAHIGALREVVSQRDQNIEELGDAVTRRDDVVQCLKLKLAREQECLAKLQDKQEEQGKRLKKQETELNEQKKQLSEQSKQLKEQEVLLNEQKTLLNKQHQPVMVFFLFATIVLLELCLLLK